MIVDQYISFIIYIYIADLLLLMKYVDKLLSFVL